MGIARVLKALVAGGLLNVDELAVWVVVGAALAFGAAMIIEAMIEAIAEQRWADEAADRDELTEVYNAERLRTDLAQLASDRAQWRAISTAIVCIDPRHVVHSDVLVAVAATIRQRRRGGDQIYRTGQYFVVLMPDSTEQQVAAVCDEIQRDIAAGSQGWPVDVTIGIATGPRRSVHEMLQEAVRAAAPTTVAPAAVNRADAAV
ncbi:MAG: diguanylate cyclase [Acidimicrobiales bacterium]|nr:diguanylate cyclase [Acidimicrobiales bacterium]